MKPGRGTLPHPYTAVDRRRISSTGPLAHDVRDAAALTDVLAERPFENGRADSFLAACDEQVPAGLRIALLTRTPLTETEPEIVAAVERVGRLLETLGHRVEPGTALDGTIEDFLPLMARMVANVPLIGLFSERIQPTTRWMRDVGKKVDPRGLESEHAQLERRIFDWFGDIDLLLTPTIPISPPRVGSFEALDGEGVFRAAAPIGAFTAPFNVTGQPAISIPAGTTRDGCPIGAQLVGRMGADRLLLSLARQLELRAEAS
jgi:amidase